MTGDDGIVPPFSVPKDWDVGYDWASYGVRLINGEPRIICKSWQGNFGDRGYIYYNREQINALLGAKGSGAFAQAHARPEDIKRVEMTIIEIIISFYRQLISKLTTKQVEVAPAVMPPEAPISPVADSVSEIVVKTSLLVPWAEAIRDYEGQPGDLSYRNNNPGNLRNTTGNFMKFKTWEAGWAALLDYLTRAATGKHKAYKPTFSLLQFFKVYSPTEDKNDPHAYATYVAKRIGVTVDTEIKNLV
jgi:hypothetical protein